MMPWSQMTDGDDMMDPVLCTSNNVTTDDNMSCPHYTQQHDNQLDIDSHDSPSPSQSHDTIYPEEATSGAMRPRANAVMFGAVMGQATAFLLIFTAFKTMSHLLVSTVQHSKELLAWLLLY